MTETNDEITYWSRFAQSYPDDNRFIIGDVTNKEIRDWLRTQFGNDDVVLEIGCGTGFFTDTVADIVQTVTAVDGSTEMLEQAKINLVRFPNVKLIHTDANEMQFESGSYDSIFLANVVHLVRNPQAIVNECYRIVKPNGRIVVVDYTSYGLSPDDKKAMMRRYMSRWGAIPEFSFAATPENLTGFVENAGFEVSEAFHVGDIAKAVCLSAVKH